MFELSGEPNAAKCGCKGVRFCLLCEHTDRVRNLKHKDSPLDVVNDFTKFCYCYVCSQLFAVGETTENAPELVETLVTSNAATDCMHGSAVEAPPNGILLMRDFVSVDEEQQLVDRIDTKPWALSQSGRRKQDYGPKVNFKHQKVKTHGFVGMPDYADEILDRMKQRQPTLLSRYQPFELCNLEYEPTRGSSIEFHMDDMWIWGERLISVNLLSGSVMTLMQESTKRLIYIPMPHRSLLCMYDDVRYKWKHGVMSEHVRTRRIALTMREAADRFQEGGELYTTFGQELIRLANLRITVD